MFGQRQWLSNPAHCHPFPHQMPEQQGSGQEHGSSFLKLCQPLSYKSNEKYETSGHTKFCNANVCVPEANIQKTTYEISISHKISSERDT